MPSEPTPDPDRLLHAQVRPPDWPTPRAAERYTLVVVGGGAAGLVSALGAAGLGARVALVERELLGGDCLVHGCVPSKALLRAGRAAQEAREAARFGIEVGPVEVDFSRVMERVRGLRAAIAADDAAQRLADAGIDVFFGQARFVGPDQIEVGGQGLRFARAILATGSAPLWPDLPGIAGPGVYSTRSLWDLDRLPRRLVVGGAGAAGVELAQAFARLGSQVVLVEREPRILPSFPAEASEVVARRLAREGVELRAQTELCAILREEGALKGVALRGPGGRSEVKADAALLVLGRRRSAEGLDPEAGQIACDATGIMVDSTLRTTNPRVYAAGDAVAEAGSTHGADAMARWVLRNALFPGARAAPLDQLPRSAHCTPEVAVWGARAGPRITLPLAHNDAARIDGEGEGFLQIVHDRRGRITGALMVGPGVADQIAALRLAALHGATLGSLAQMIAPYPTRSDLWKRAGDTWNRGRLRPWMVRLVQRWFRWMR